MDNWNSKDPVYKGFINSICIIEYRNETRQKYKVGDTIDGTNMIIQSCDKDSVVVHLDSNKNDIQKRVFYMSKDKEKNK